MRPARRPRRRREKRGGDARSLTVLQALGKGVGQAGGADGRSGACDVVLAALPRRRRRRGVQEQPGRPRVAVARLADGAGIDEPLAGAYRGALAGAARLAGGDVALGPVEAERHVGVSDQADAARLLVEAQLGEQRAQDVLPDRVARAGMEEPDLALVALGLQAGEPLHVVTIEHLLGPARGDRSAT